MTEIRGAATRAEKKPSYFSGRGNRKEYWFSIGVIFALSLVLYYFMPDLSGSGMTMAVIFTQIRRLHDLDHTGWWSIVAQGAGLAVGLLAWPLTSMEIGAVIGGTVPLGFLVWVGCVRGDPYENRFGKPQTKPFAVT